METLETNDWRSGLDLGKALVERPTSFSRDQLIRLLTSLNNQNWEPSAELDPALEPVQFVGSLGERPASPGITVADIPEELFENRDKFGENGRAKRKPSTQKRAKLGFPTTSFGGPLGPLPTLLVEEIRRRAQLGDIGTSAFLDIFIHRLVSLGYSIKRDFKPSLETRDPKESAGHQFIRTLLGGTTTEHPKEGEDVSDEVFLKYSSLLLKRPLSAESIRRIIADYLGVDVKIKELVGRWLCLSETDLNRIGVGECNNRLGQNLVIGEKIWDQQSGITLEIGPLSSNYFKALLPGNPANKRLKKLLKFCVSSPTLVRATLFLEDKAHLSTKLSASEPSKLGWTSWLQNQNNADRITEFTVLESSECV